MKTKLTTTVLCLFILLFSIQQGKAQHQLIHFWDFNSTVPAGGGAGDSLGTAYSYVNTFAQDNSVKTGTLYVSYTKLAGSVSGNNPYMLCTRPTAIQTVPLVCTLRDSIVDNGSGGSVFYDYNAYGYNYFNTSDTGNSSVGNLFIRSRNPSENEYVYMFTPTTGYQNIQINFALTASSSKGAKYNIFQYSADGGVTWNPIPKQTQVAGFTSARWSSWANRDSLLVCSATTTAIDSSKWCPISINLSSVAAANNNPNFMVRWELVGAGSNGASGNDRYDNFAVLGDSNTSNVSAFIINRKNVSPCYGDSNGSARVYNLGGTPPYTYSWSSNASNSLGAGGLTTDSAYGLKAGTYTVTVTDNADIASKAVVTILQPAQVVPVVTSSKNVSCNGGSNGTATVLVSGGTSPYTYSWALSGGTSATANNLSLGTYTCTATDQVGCSGTVSAVINQPTAINTSTSTTPVTCTVLGSATITTSGGTPFNGGTYTYSWSSGNTTSSFFGGTGTYSCTVTDSMGCTATNTAIITTSGAVASLTVTGNVNCNGGTNGSISSSVSGGASPYTYAWSPGGATTTAISGLSAGAYTLTVTENDGCKTAAVANVTQPAALHDTVINANPQALIHYWDFNGTAPAGGAGGDSLGSSVFHLPADVSVLPGLNPHMMYSHPSATASLLDNGTPGGFVNDLPVNGNDTGSSTAGNLFVRSRNPVMGSQFLWYIPTTGYQNISLDWALSASSGKGAQYLIFSYSADGGSTWNKMTAAMDTFNQNGRPRPDSMVAINAITILSGWYPVHIDFSSIPAANDNPNLVFRIEFGGSNVTNTSGNNRFDNVSVKGSEDSHVSCHGGNNAAGTAVVSGGTVPYTYNWSNGATTSSVTDLVGGLNTVTVTDNNGCSAIATVNVYNPPALLDSVSPHNGCYNANNGSATANPNGGTAPYTYSWSTGSISDSVSNLAPGGYTVTVTDNNGCTSVTTTSIVNPTQLTSSPTLTNVNCFGGNDGSASANAAGGTSPYTYSWTSGATTSSTSGLTAGNDTVTITDNNTCTVTAIAAISQPTQVRDSINASDVAEGCVGNNDGSALVSVKGGTLPYAYSWSNGASSAMANGLSAGSYTVTVTDGNSCSNTVTVTISPNSLPSITFNLAGDSTQCDSITSIDFSSTASPTGGTFRGTGITGNNFQPSVAGDGTYAITYSFTNGSGCSDSAMQTVRVYSCITTGTPQVQLQNKINIYPNPANSQVTISGLIKGSTIEMYNDIGMLIKTVSVNAGTTPIDISEMADGMYLFRIISTDGTAVIQQKVIKTK